MRSKQVPWALPVALALTLALTPFGRAVHLLLPGGTMGYYASAFLLETVLWGLPALALGRRCGVKQARKMPVCCIAAVVGLCLQAAVAAALTIGGAPEEGTVPLPTNVWEWLAAVPALVIAPAVCEEGFFRGALMQELRERMGAAGALVASTAVFALLHGAGWGLPGQAAVGLLSGLLLLTTGSLGASILLHLGYNGAALALCYCPREDGLILLGIVPVAALVWLMRRLPREKLRSGLWDGLLLAAILAAAIGRID